jgi:hypothetical protein
VQRYTIGILVCTVFYQDPLLLGVVVTGSNGLHYVSKCMTTTAFSINMMLVLFIFDSIKLSRYVDAISEVACRAVWLWSDAVLEPIG